MTTVVVAGALANKCGVPGEAWVRMSWASGFRRLGFDVVFVEQISPELCTDSSGRKMSLHDSIQAQWFGSVVDQFGFSGSATLVCDGVPPFGMDGDELRDRLSDAALLVNISGHLRSPDLFGLVRTRAFVDIDPGFTQLWHLNGEGAALEGHHFHFTIGENIGTEVCSIPTCGIRWRPLRQPVVLDMWPQVLDAPTRGFTTIATWRAPFGRPWDGVRSYDLKMHQFRRFIDVPLRSGHRFELALSIDPADLADLVALKRSRWEVVYPTAVVESVSDFRSYVQSSGAEFSCAQGVYVETSSGWFSDRSARYLASGRPVVVQDTGISRTLPVGEGLLCFSDLDDALAAVDDVANDYPRHAKAARAIAEQEFDSDVVLGRLLEETGVAP
jgi:hypothetical protein